MIHFLLLVLGLALLIKSADWLVRGASSIARALRVSEFVIGLTVVSFGTSLPELVIGVIAPAANADLIIGNVIGSNICNIFLILGVAALIRPLPAARTTVWREIPYTLIAALILVALVNDHVIDRREASEISRIDGLILLGFFSAFLVYIVQVVRADQDRDWVGSAAHDPVPKSIAEILGGLAGLIIGGRVTVDNAANIAADWGMSEVFIGLTIIAVGTSLPELATSAVAAWRNNVDIAVGNVVGSNIFNIFAVLGLSSLLHPMAFNTANNLDLAVMTLASVLLFLFMFIGRPRHALERHEGLVFLLLYTAYLAYAVLRG